jgi:hypothetical protein
MSHDENRIEKRATLLIFRSGFLSLEIELGIY